MRYFTKNTKRILTIIIIRLLCLMILFWLLTFGYHLLLTQLGVIGFQPQDRMLCILNFEKTLAIPSIIISHNDNQCVIPGHSTDASISLATIYYDFNSSKKKVTFEGIGDWGLIEFPAYYTDISSLNRLLDIKALSSYYDCAALGNKNKYGYSDLALFRNGAIATFPAARLSKREAISIINTNIQDIKELIVPDLVLTNDYLDKQSKLCIFNNDQHLALFYKENIFYFNISDSELTHRKTVPLKLELISNVATNGKYLFGIYKNVEDHCLYLYEFHPFSNEFDSNKRVISHEIGHLVYATISSDSQIIVLSAPEKIPDSKKTKNSIITQFISHIKIIDTAELKIIEAFEIDGFCDFMNLDSTSTRLALCGINDYKSDRISSHVRVYDLNSMNYISLKKVNGIMGNATPQFIDTNILAVPTGNSITIWDVKFR
ncbi:MAG: hypothetical protein LBE13_22500 [Bacteroidales bacterium]|jgi:hypothetical protein|nr:hypothetical protein [Bacteroidales bacterium]